MYSSYRCHVIYDRRFIPGETPESCLKEIQDLVDRISKEDLEFKATVEISTQTRTS